MPLPPLLPRNNARSGPAPPPLPPPPPPIAAAHHPPSINPAALLAHARAALRATPPAPVSFRQTHKRTHSKLDGRNPHQPAESQWHEVSGFRLRRVGSRESPGESPRKDPTELEAALRKL